TVAQLRRPKSVQTAMRLAHGSGWQDHDLVFPSTDGRPMHSSTLYNGYRRTIKKYNDELKKAHDNKKRLSEEPLPVIRFHDLRHTHATLLLKQGTHPKVVQERLGHASITLTLDTYSHVLPGLQEEASAALENLVGRRLDGDTQKHALHD